MSFRDEVAISMVASNHVKHNGKMPWVKTLDANVLPICAIFGGNSSGKSNLFKAFEFLENYITMSFPVADEIPVDQFLLDKELQNGVTKFYISLLINQSVYNYSFEITRNQVLNEKLEINKRGKKPALIYKRTHTKRGAKISFFCNHSKEVMTPASQDIGDCNLVLSSPLFNELDDIKNVYEWFKDSLFLLSPKDKFNFSKITISDDEQIYDSLTDFLSFVGVNIANMGVEEMDFEKIDIPMGVKQGILNKIKLNPTQQAILSHDNVLYVLKPSGKNITFGRMFIERFGTNGDLIKFDIARESSGTKNLLNLVPLLLGLTQKKSKLVVFVDEFDSSLHVNLTETLVNFFLSGTENNSRSQLLFTTHEVDLLSSGLLREDEVIFVEQNSLGISSIQRASAYDLSDPNEDVRKSYKEGQFGGISDIYPVSTNQLS